MWIKRCLTFFGIIPMAILSISCNLENIGNIIKSSLIPDKWVLVVDPDTLEEGQLISLLERGPFYYPWQGEETLRCSFIGWRNGKLKVNGKLVGLLEWGRPRRNLMITQPANLLIFSGRRIPKELRKCPNLTVVEIVPVGTNSFVVDSTLEYLKGAKDLRVLVVLYPNITDKGYEIISGFKELEILEFHLGKDGDVKLRHFSELARLKEVAFSGEVNGVGFKNWKSDTCLRKLDILYCGVSSEGLKYIAAFTNLESLKLGVDGVTDSDLQLLNSLQNLRVLELSVRDANGVTYDGLARLHSSLTDCVLYYGGSHGRLSFSPDGTNWECPGPHTAQ